MKMFTILSVIAAIFPMFVVSHPLLEVGASTQYKTQDNLGNYAFGYNEDHTSGGSFRKEVGDFLGNKAGSYGLHDADGRARVVNYVADGDGFRADVHSNEPGVDPSQDPADVTVNKPAVAVVAAPAAVITHPTAIIAHKTVLSAPVAAIASNHHAVTVLHAPVYHAPLIVGHLPHFLL